MTEERHRIAANIADVRQRIAAAAGKSGREPEDVRLVAVSKWVEEERVALAVGQWIVDFGENYIQELIKKANLFPQNRWHMIGQIQKNKVKYMPGVVQLIHSLDSWGTAEEIDRRFAQAGQAACVLVQVNIGRESQKAGLPPEEVPGFCERLRSMAWIRLQGLMAIPPAGSPEETRPFFARMRELFERIQSQTGPLDWLSMGMSADYEAAIEEGANMVRVGSSIFGNRPSKDNSSR